MVRDESDVIEETISHLFGEGVDRVLVADNLSTDATPQILRSLALRFPVDVISDPVPEYWQGEKMTLLVRAATRLGASWIVPFDADELWYGAGPRTVAETLRQAVTPVVSALWFDYLPIESGAAGSVAERFPYRMREPSALPKVAFRANWLARLTVGNHGVTVPDTSMSPGLRIAHFRVRSIEQMRRKAANGADAVRRSGLPTKVDYWFRVAAADDQGAAQEYDRLTRDTDAVLDPATQWHAARP